MIARDYHGIHQHYAKKENKIQVWTLKKPCYYKIYCQKVLVIKHERQDAPIHRALDCNSQDLGSVLSSATLLLCDLGEIISPSCAALSLSPIV